jgi:hypothetical protein
MMQAPRWIAALLVLAGTITLSASPSRADPPSEQLAALQHPTGILVGALTSFTGGQASSIDALERQLHRRLAIAHHFDDMETTFPTEDEKDDIAKGRIPLVSLRCNDTDANIAAGSQDKYLVAEAQAMKAAQVPIFLRYKREFNLRDFTNNGAKFHCIDRARDVGERYDPQAFVAAWRHIHEIFRTNGALNVLFVWCPAAGGIEPTRYYPGDDQVDWVGFDAYDRRNEGVEALWSKPYSWMQAIAPSKPVMVAETGAAKGPGDNFLNAGTASLIESRFPNIHAVVYFSWKGAQDWALSEAGVASFAQFAAQSQAQAGPHDKL